MKIIVGSKNPVKIEAVKEVFGHYFKDADIEGFETDSHVSHTPFDDDVFLGAKNRTDALKKNDADFYAGIEGGIIKIYDRWFLVTVACIADKYGQSGYGIGPGLPMPEHIVERVLSGVELGNITDEIAKDTNMKQKGGYTEIMTHGFTNRKDPTVQAVLRALVPFLNKEIYVK